MRLHDPDQFSVYELQPSYSLPASGRRGVSEGINEAGLVTAQELSRRTGMSESVIYDLASRNEIPHVKIGRWTRFKWISILKWLDERERGSVES